MTRRILGDPPTDPWQTYDAAVAATDAALHALAVAQGGAR